MGTRGWETGGNPLEGTPEREPPEWIAGGELWKVSPWSGPPGGDPLERTSGWGPLEGTP
jgi:hypothetical protein